jgi:hypothetical protein
LLLDIKANGQNLAKIVGKRRVRQIGMAKIHLPQKCPL